MTIRKYEPQEKSDATSADTPGQIIELCIELLKSLQVDAEREFASFSEDIVAASKQVAKLKQDSVSQEQEDVSAYINSLLTRMQFSDRFCQRVDNTRRSLEGLSRKPSNSFDEHLPVKPLPEKDATCLLAQTRNIFTTEQERNLFDQMFGVPENIDTEDTALTSDSEAIFLFDD